ncbi:MAG: alpha/beta fold hydrolase [Candidatus Helarchaeota archaeon]
MPFVELDKGYKVYYIEKGKGQPVVFSHGYLGSSWLFETQIDYFSEKGYHTIAIDHLGHGKSDKPESEEYLLQDLANYLEEVLAKILGDEKIVLVGHSMGGMIALIYATTPELAKRLKGLVLMSTAPKLQNPGLDQYIKDIDAGTLKIRDEDSVRNILVNLCFHRSYKKLHKKDIIEEFVQLSLNNEEYVGVKTMHAIVKNYDVANKIKNIDVPTLILTGDRDIFIQPRDSEEMAKVISNSKLIKFSPKIGHMIQFEARDEYHKALEDFLSSL